jgi:zinc transporter ZupT
MTTGDWIAWGIFSFIGTIFLWLGLLEEFVPLWVGAIIGVMLFIALIRFGPRIREEEEEGEEE